MPNSPDDDDIDVPFDIAIDVDGHPLPYTPEDVRGIVKRALEGEILAVILKMPNGDLAVQAIGEATLAIPEALETAARAYRLALKGHA